MVAREKKDCWYRDGYAAGWLAAINEYSRTMDEDRVDHHEAYERCCSHYDDTLIMLGNNHSDCSSSPKDIPPIPPYHPSHEWRRPSADWPPRDFASGGGRKRKDPPDF